MAPILPAPSTERASLAGLLPPGTRRRPILSLAPLIDVTFLLLVFFMLVTQFDRFGVIDVTVAKSAPVQLEDPAVAGGARDRVRLVIEEKERLLLDGAELTLAELVPALKSLRGGSPAAGAAPPLLLLEPEPKVRLQWLVEVFSELATQALYDVRLVHRQTSDHGLAP